MKKYDHWITIESLFGHHKINNYNFGEQNFNNQNLVVNERHFNYHKVYGDQNCLNFDHM
jgi:hypothetical protein